MSNFTFTLLTSSWIGLHVMSPLSLIASAGHRGATLGSVNTCRWGEGGSSRTSRSAWRGKLSLPFPPFAC